MAESQKNLLRVEIPEDGGDAAMRSSSSKGDISTDAKTRSKFSPAVVLNKLNPLEIAKMPGKAVNKLRSRNTVDPRKMAARNAQFNSAMAREGDKVLVDGRGCGAGWVDVVLSLGRVRCVGEGACQG